MRRQLTWTAGVVLAMLLVPAAAPVSSAGAGRSVTVAAVAPPGAARPTLSLGATGDAVSALQRRLGALGAPLVADGRFGPATRQAVIAFQVARSLPPDGIVGALTWQALDGGGPSLLVASNPASATSARPILRLGSVGPPVAEAQRLLTRAGQPVAADGRFGPATARAVVAFQRAHRLTADGVVGPATWSALPGGVPVAVVPITAVVPAAWPIYGARPYLVRVGDSLASIAAANHSTAQALASANRLAPGSRPAVGSTIFVPGSWRCPVPGAGFINDFGFARAGHLHMGNDLFAPRNTPVVAPVGGHAEPREGGLGGRAVQLFAADGNRYYFAHLDHFGTTGAVAAGTVIGYVGNSGNAATTVTHSHFEIHPGGGPAVNPFPTLTLACRH